MVYLVASTGIGLAAEITAKLDETKMNLEDRGLLRRFLQ